MYLHVVYPASISSALTCSCEPGFFSGGERKKHTVPHSKPGAPRIPRDVPLSKQYLFPPPYLHKERPSPRLKFCVALAGEKSEGISNKRVSSAVDWFRPNTEAGRRFYFLCFSLARRAGRGK